MQQVRTPDGRTLEVWTAGDPGRLPVVYHSGTPSAAVPWPQLDRTAAAAGMSVVSWSRPGYAGSSEQPGRRVADVAADTEVVLDQLGVGEFVTFGWSGGGPHALACAALLPHRCRAAATLAGVAPYDATDLDFLAGMGAENEVEFQAALAGRRQVERVLTDMAAGLAEVTPDQVAEALGDLVTPVDKRALTGELADYLARGFRASVSTGVAGWRDDDLAFTAPWGFDVSEVTVPVAVWQGDEDRMVPYAHGQWLAGHVAGAEPHLVGGQGHLSLVQRVGDVLDGLRRSADGRSGGGPS